MPASSLSRRHVRHRSTRPLIRDRECAIASRRELNPVPLAVRLRIRNILVRDGDVAAAHRVQQPDAVHALCGRERLHHSRRSTLDRAVVHDRHARLQ